MTNPAGLVAMVPSENDAANWRRWPTGFPPQKPHFSSGIVLRIYILETIRKASICFYHNYILNLLIRLRVVKSHSLQPLVSWPS